jgi:hypothetical protein
MATRIWARHFDDVDQEWTTKDNGIDLRKGRHLQHRRRPGVKKDLSSQTTADVPAVHHNGSVRAEAHHDVADSGEV